MSMKTSHVLPLLLLAAVAACRPAPETAALENDAAATDSTNVADVAAPDAPATDINASLALDQLSGTRNHLAPPPGADGRLPPADAPLRFVGRWASEAGMCENAAWRFSADELRTPAGSVCRFDEISPIEGGYDIAAHCTAEGPEREDTLRIRFAESAQAMLFESESVAGDGLIYCGPN